MPVPALPPQVIGSHRQEHLWVDFSYTKPPLSTLTKYAGIIGYVSGNPSKNLPRDLAHKVVAAGRRVLLVWQQGGTGPLGGRTQGEADAREANRQAAALGYPTDLPIVYAVDFDATPNQLAIVASYFQGALAASQRPVGGYGGFRTIERLAGANLGFYWQARAWSAGRVHPAAHLLQEAGAPFHGTAGVDENTVLRPFRSWGASR